MKDSIKLMQIYRQYLEMTGSLVELLERHMQVVEKNNLSDRLKDKYAEFRKHAQNVIETMNADLHVLIRLDTELKEIEDLEKKERK